MAKSILMIVGSLREASFNRQLAAEAERLMDGRALVTRLEWADVPLLNQDIESPVPASVQRVRDAVLAADAVWICSPEYNGNIPGGLKNLLDWLSRPMDPADRKSPNAVAGKPVALCGAGGAAATAGVRENLRKMLSFIGMQVVGGAGVGVALGAESFISDRLLLSDGNRAELAALADEFLSAL